MKRKRTCATVDVEGFDGSLLVPLLTMGCIVAIDVAKTKFVAAIATAAASAAVKAKPKCEDKIKKEVAKRYGAVECDNRSMRMTQQPSSAARPDRIWLREG